MKGCLVVWGAGVRGCGGAVTIAWPCWVGGGLR